MKRLLGTYTRAVTGEEDTVAWAGQGRRGVETIRKVGCEGEEYRAKESCGGPFKRF